MRYVVASGILLVGWALSLLLGMSVAEGIAITTMLVVAFTSEKVLSAHIMTLTLLHTGTITEEDILDMIEKKGQENGQN
jgi:hypothetical protein